MADADEDNPDSTSQNPDLTDLTDETQDFRFLSTLSQSLPLADPSSLTTTSNAHPTIPRRGEKDFEPHGTTHQAHTLASSRHAMHTALSHPRYHVPKSHIIGHFDPESGMTVVERAKGQHFRTMGRADARGRVWLAPEEAVYLCERGSLDVRWPVEKTEGHEEDEEEGEVEGEGVVMSLQGVYASLMGRGGVDLERYVVYAGLKRSGYIVHRAPSWGDGDDYSGGEETGRVAMVSREKKQGYWGVGLFAQIFKWLGTSKPNDHLRLGPLVTPGLYRSYNDIYRLLSIIPNHNPTLPPSSPPTPTSTPFRITYHIYKPSPTFKKSSPGPPDFRIAVINARESSVPTLAQLSALLESTPYDPPPKSMEKQVYQRLKHGYRNVVLAVVDQGVVSYLRLADAGFGQERIYERFGRGGGGKRGGRGGGRGGRGRGRGRR